MGAEERSAAGFEFRSLWIQRINAAAREHDVSYSQMMSGLNQAGIELDRRILSELAMYEPQSFTAVVDVAKETATPLTKNALNLVPMTTVDPDLLAAITNATRNNPKSPNIRQTHSRA